MELTMSLIRQIGALFVMILIGYMMVRKKLCRSEDSKVLSVIVLYAVVPCVIIQSFQIEMTEEKVCGFLLSIAAAVLIHAVYIILAKALGGIFKFDAVEKASVIYSNCGNLIIPLVSIVLGPEMVFYTSGYLMVQLVLLWTHCKIMISGEKDISLKKIFLNVNMISIGIGIILFMFQIHIPSLVSSAFNGMGSLLGPLSMLVVGMILADMPLKQYMLNGRIYLITILRLIVFPLAVMAVFKMTGLLYCMSGAAGVLMISMLAACAPTASTVTQFAQLYQCKPEKAGAINAIGILCCIITMPLIVMLYQYCL